MAALKWPPRHRHVPTPAGAYGLCQCSSAHSIHRAVHGIDNAEVVYNEFCLGAETHQKPADTAALQTEM
ncbi:hypothetical protein SKAU_G00045490 [Synaphobranchus kaupii]|uniref:Uncharacterized protein n=1 Tax=Synaphobranchus kaupii TaxID=118154 RepID=A0A9Q1G207_SYNKA|nr:hypothetical protein SKAU_G00045490 [Synaphobranchus kaupii]